MRIFRLNQENAPAVAGLMSTIRPIWWDYKGALAQLSGVDTLIETVGWFLGADENSPKGWVLCCELKLFNSIELECCGYDDDGNFALEHKLGALFDIICDYAKSKGYLTFRTAMGSQGFNIHNRKLGNIGDEINNLTSDNRIDYDWLLEYGFKVVGIQPNAYGDKFHCILLAKNLIGDVSTGG
jgi:hypothetical protein